MSKSLYTFPQYYDADPREFLREELEFIKKLIESIPNIQSICDIGCGTGRVIHFLKNTNRKLLGVDNNQEMLEIAKKRLINSEKVFLYNTNILTDKLSLLIDHPVDLVLFSYNFFQHFGEEKEWLTIIRNAASILSPQGGILINLTNVTEAQSEGPPKIDYSVPFESGVLTRTQQVLAADEAKLTLEILFQYAEQNGGYVKKDSCSLLFYKIKWVRLFKACLQNNLLPAWLKLGYETGANKRKISLFLSKKNFDGFFIDECEGDESLLKFRENNSEASLFVRYKKVGSTIEIKLASEKILEANKDIYKNLLALLTLKYFDHSFKIALSNGHIIIENILGKLGFNLETKEGVNTSKEFQRDPFQEFRT